MRAPFAALTAAVHPSGMNPSIGRVPRFETTAVPLRPPGGTGPALAAEGPGRVMTVKLTFPEGVPLLDPPAAKRPKPDAPVRKPGKRTRLRPPSETLALSDRLFYMLQPPLEELLAGQDLNMPFEPFPYQYQGIAWLFSHDSALLADEMGLGKTMQTIHRDPLAAPGRAGAAGVADLPQAADPELAAGVRLLGGGDPPSTRSRGTGRSVRKPGPSPASPCC